LLEHALLQKTIPVEGEGSISYQDEANKISSDATFNLFNWHKNNEKGLWLAEGQNNINTIRKI